MNRVVRLSINYSLFLGSISRNLLQYKKFNFFFFSTRHDKLFALLLNLMKSTKMKKEELFKLSEKIN